MNIIQKHFGNKKKKWDKKVDSVMSTLLDFERGGYPTRQTVSGGYSIMSGNSYSPKIKQKRAVLLTERDLHKFQKINNPIDSNDISESLKLGTELFMAQKTGKSVYIDPASGKRAVTAVNTLKLSRQRRRK